MHHAHARHVTHAPRTRKVLEPYPPFRVLDVSQPAVEADIGRATVAEESYGGAEAPDTTCGVCSGVERE